MRQQNKGLVRTQKETDQARDTHQLQTAEEGSCWNTERNQPRNGYSLPGDHRGRDLSKHKKKPTEQGALTLWTPERNVLVRTQNGSDRARCAHTLETAEGGACQDTERNRPGKGHSQTGDHRGTCQDTERNQLSERCSLPGDHRGRDMLGHGKEATK